MMQGQTIPVTVADIVGEAAKIKVEGYTLLTISCVETGENRLELIYHFDRDFNMRNFRLSVSKDAVVPSLSCVYWAAFLVENEIQDLFSLRFSNLVIDFNRTLYLEKVVAAVPFCRLEVKRRSKPVETGPPDPSDEPPTGK